MQGYEESGPLLHKLVSPDRMDLVARREFGDDVLYPYLVRYPQRTLEVALGLASDRRISHFSLRQTERE